MQYSNPKISIIFPSYNGAKFLRENLNSIKIQNTLDELEIVIIDNMSNDSSINVIKSYEKDLNIKLIKNNVNKGFAKACNSGVQNSKGKFIFITNQDVIFPPDFFTKLLKIYSRVKKKDEIALSPAVVFQNGKIHYFGAKNHFLGFSYTPQLGKKLPETKIIKKTQRISGGALFISKDFFLQMGGFDRVYFMYYEDTDFSLKILRNGYKIYTTNDPFLIHQKNYHPVNHFQYYFLEQNRLIFWLKNVESINKLIPFVIIMELLLLFHSFFIRKFKIRIKIYQNIIFRLGYLKNLREKSKREGSLTPYRKLSKNLDPILLGGLERFKIFRKSLILLNKIFNLI